ncbi:MAG TPA: sigma-70 family RNA polymerase sigma factor [Polyangiaceae bacterium]|jgi:RNA polymerase sigma factor (sigma-70 family)
MREALGPERLALLRELAPRVLGVVARRFGDFAAAEDAVQEALLAAAEHWPREGLPDNPRGWLIRVASRRLLDHVRAETSRRKREATVASLEPPEERLALAADADAEPTLDDTLDLLFICCNPVLSSSSAIALTLRAVGGLTTAEIASAFLVPEATMAQRISRAKQSIAAAGVPFEPPSSEERAARLGAVMHVIYLIFNEGYAASSGADLLRNDLSEEALRLARLLLCAVPRDTEAAGLLALLLLTHARRFARTGSAGELIPLDEQDRSRWDRGAVAEGVALLSATLARGAVGSYQLQAAIAAVHDEAASTESTDWSQILGLYGLLLRISDNPLLRLNQAIALAMVHGPDAALAHLATLEQEPRLAGHHRLYAVRAHLLERIGQCAAAAREFQRAAERTTSLAERDYLLTRAARLSGRLS